MFPDRISARLRQISQSHQRGAMKRGQGTCSRFQSFQLTYHAHTTLIDIYRQSPIFSLVTNTQLRYNHVWYVCIPLNRPRYVHVPNRPLNRPRYVHVPLYVQSYMNVPTYLLAQNVYGPRFTSPHQRGEKNRLWAKGQACIKDKTQSWNCKNLMFTKL